MNLIKSKFKRQVDASGKVSELEIRKYDRKVFYENLWGQDENLVKNRGSVFVDGVQVVFPMDKCFNYKENGAGENLPLDTKVRAYKKLNGFMVNLTHVSSIGWVISTTGDAIVIGNETSNKFLQMAMEYIREFDGQQTYMDIYFDQNNFEVGNTLTVTFEVCHPDDVHIVDEKFGLHPICYQLNGVTKPIDENGEVMEVALSRLLNYLKGVEHEGFMVYDMEGNLLFKLKSPFYLAKKWIQRGGEDNIYSNKYRERLDEEFYPIINFIRANNSAYIWAQMSEEQKAKEFLRAYDYCLGC